MNFTLRSGIQCVRILPVIRKMYSTQIHHDKECREFQIYCGSDKAVLQYKEIGPGSIDLLHTLVPDSLKRKGIGGMLAEEALQYVVDNNIKVRITCMFVQNYLKKKPKEEIKKLMLD